MGPEYWGANLREPVRLDLAMAELQRQGYTLFLEVSAHPQLLIPLSELLGPDSTVVESLRRGQGEYERLQRGAVELGLNGYELDWAVVLGRTGRQVQLPTYAFQRQLYWPELAALSSPSTSAAERAFWAAVEQGDPDALARSLDVQADQMRSALRTLLPKLAQWRSGAAGERQTAAHGHSPSAVPLALAELRSLPSEESSRYLIEYLRSEVARVLMLPVEKLDIDQGLMELGLDSIMAMAIKRRVEQGLAVRLSIVSLLKGATVVRLAKEVALSLAGNPTHETEASDSVATHTRPELSPPGPAPDLGKAPAHSLRVVSGAASSRKPWVHLRQRPGAALHLICFPYAGGGPAVFHPWLEMLPETIDVSVLQLPGRGARLDEAPYTSMEQLVEELTPSLAGVLAQGPPFELFGYSLGSLIAFEVAGQLVVRHGLVAEHLFVGGTRAPRWHTAEQHGLDVLQFSPLVGVAEHELPEADLVDMLSTVALGGSRAALQDEELRQLLLPAVRADFRVYRSYLYKPQPLLPFPITAIGGRADPIVSAIHLTSWQQHTSASCRVRFLSGDHSIIETQRQHLVQLVAEPLRRSHHLSDAS